MATANTKGTNLVDMVKFLRKQRDAALAILPRSLHRYLDETLNVAAWYPEEDMIGLVRALAQLLPVGGEDPLVQIGRLNARMHLQGTYTHLIAEARPEMLPVRALALWRSMHDTGEFRLTVEKDHAEARLAGYGFPTSEMCTMLGAYLLELFELAGVKSPQVVERACCRHGARECRWLLEWPESETGAPVSG